MIEHRFGIGELGEGISFDVDEIHKITLLTSRRFRFAGMFFDTGKCFLLPVAIPGIRRITEIHAENPSVNLLIVGHTDTSGTEEFNLKLSLERAEAVAAYLTDDAETWIRHFDEKEEPKRWGTREIQFMLRRTTDAEGPFLVGPADGKAGPETETAIRRFQSFHGLAVDGVAGPMTRKALVEAYMSLDRTSLPKDAKVTAHGCGESFPVAEVKDGAKSPQDRRAEVFFFDGDIDPAPPGKTSKKGSKEYPKWAAAATETVDLVLAELIQGFDFDLPNQKVQVLEPGPEPDAGGDDAPILVAANDDRLVAKLVQEARDQNKKRGKDDSDTSADGDFIPFRMVDKPARPDIRMDHGFLDDGNGNLDKSKMREATFSDGLSYMKWSAKLEAAEILRPDLFDATQTYRHFLDATGTEFRFKYDKFAEKDKAGGKSVESALEDTIAAALELSDAQKKPDFSMQTDPIGVGGFNGRYPYPGTENWQKAIGAHVIWLEAHVTVEIKEDKRFFRIDMTLHAEDRYNFNPGAKDIATGTPDADNGVFELTGLGKEFDSTSTLRRHIEFSAGKDPIADFRKPPGDRKVTKPR
ncbi:MAG: hypothetical protein JWP91_3045 [Fibrobacteres bacterium]|nr:hypothetical protein [Fibrobacterota bacterium]